jgi:putative ABC transport system permease protein
MWSDFRQDLSYGVRSLVRTPAFTGVALVTLALGIGANTAIFSVIHGVLLKPLPYRDADRLVFVWSSASAFPRAPLTPGRLIDFREQLGSVTGLAGISHIPLNLTGTGEAERLSGSSVSSNFFDVLGVPALLGDPFHAGRADDRDLVLSYGLWTRRFGGDPKIIGREITINASARRIVAVMPAEFEWPAITGAGSSNGGAPELWIPAARGDVPRMPRDDPNQDLSANRSAGYLRAVGRLKAGATLADAQRESERLTHRFAALYPRTDSGRGAVVQPMREQFFGTVRQPLFVLVGAVAFVLAIACANAASLLLGRASSRRREIAVRLAIGASRGRIVKQLLTESAILSLAGAGLGLIVASSARAWLVALAPAGILRLEATRLDPAVLVFTLGLALCTGLIFGLVPAWQASRLVSSEDLGDGGGRTSSGRRATRTRDLLVAGQVAIALVLLVGAGLLIRSLSTLSRVDTGIDARNLLAFDLFLSGSRAAAPVQQVAFYNDLLRELRALPGVQSAGAAVTLPIGGDDFATTFLVEGRPVPPPSDEPTAGYQIVTPGYFATMGMRIRAGRDFSESDTRESPAVVIVNETLARQHWPGAEPVGRRLRIGRGTSNPWMTVVGVVSDIRHLGPSTAPRPELYEVHTQSPFSFMAFVVRTNGDAYAAVPSIRAAVARLDAAQPVSGVRSMDDHLARSLSRPRFMSTLTSAFATLALTLAVIGLYGVIAYSVTQRTREIAIRAALGARPVDVMRMVIGKAVALAGAGIAAGVAAAAALARLLTGLLYGVTPTDPATYLAVAALLMGVAMVSGAVPAVRAVRIDGARALKT